MSDFVTRPTPFAATLLDEVAKSLEIPDSRYQAAERSYKSLSEWLNRPTSRLASFGTEIYPQGSFRLGTVIKPLNDDEEYDLDVVCEISTSKLTYSQAELKALVGREIADYAEARSMQRISESRRCWTLNYADEAQFHMDVIPSLPDATFQRQLIEAQAGKNQWADTAIAITDREHALFRQRTDRWPGSNPVGYANWFLDRTKVAFEKRRAELALLEKRANVEEIPDYRVKTPLQNAIQILKRHRDIQFSDDQDNRPISIILTTLAAHSYEQETTIGAALFGILERMDRYISYRGDVAWIPNPTDPRENFADRWVTHPERREAFFNWLRQARHDFSSAGQAGDLDAFAESLAPSIGRRLVESAVEKRRPKGLLNTALGGITAASALLRRVLAAPHKVAPNWPMSLQGTAQIARATYTQRGKAHSIKSDGMPLAKGGDLRFEVQTNIQPPYNVYWQVVNTGPEATAGGGLRGGFELPVANTAGLVRTESTKYRGTHSIECLIVKDGRCVAKSDPFIVTIA